MLTTTGKATEFITFTRASLATVTDADGLIKWAPHNLLSASEQFGAFGWTKTTVTVAANADPAPNSTTTADTLTATGANSTGLQTWTAEAVSYTFGVWLKRKTGTGTIEIAADSGTYTAVTITSSWALYTVTQTPAAGSKSAGIRIVTSGDEVYAWGAHLYRSDLGGMVANTSAYPYYNPTTAKNLLGNSENFSAASADRSRVTVIDNEIVAPNGLQTADRINATTTFGTHGVQPLAVAVTSVSGTTYVASAYVKAAEYTKVGIRENSSTGAYATFSLIGAGSVIAQGDGGLGAIIAVGDGWYRISMSSYVTGSVFLPQYILASYFILDDGYTSGSPSAYSYAGTGFSGLYLWGAQLSDSASLDPYVASPFAAPVAGAYHGPRRDFDPVTLACKGLLVEEQRTNLLLQSAAFDNANWTKNNSTATANAAAAPDGTSTADLIVPTTTAGVTHSVYQSVTVTAVDHTLSVFVKEAGYTRVKIANLFTGAGVSFNVSAGTVGTASAGNTGTITSVGNGWYRCAITFTAAAETTLYGLYVEDASGNVVYAGDGTSGVYVWGAQLEAGSFATSYIPTGASSVTRSADVASVATSAFPYSSTEGSLVAAFTPVSVAAARRAAQLDDATADERITLGIDSTPNGLMTVIDGGSSQASIATGTPAANTTMKLAARYKVNDFAVSANGAAVGTDTSGTLPTMNTLRLGSGTSSTEPLNGWLRQITYLPRALTDAELQTRTV